MNYKPYLRCLAERECSKCSSRDICARKVFQILGMSEDTRRLKNIINCPYPTRSCEDCLKRDKCSKMARRVGVSVRVGKSYSEEIRSTYAKDSTKERREKRERRQIKPYV